MLPYGIRYLYNPNTALTSLSSTTPRLGHHAKHIPASLIGHLQNSELASMSLLEGDSCDRFLRELSAIPDTYEAERCTAVTAGWNSYELHVADPVSIMRTTLSNDTCLLDPAHVCGSDGYTAFVVNATTLGRVKSGVDPTWENNARFVTQSTCHDDLSRSIAPGSVSIWVYHMQGSKYHPDEFQIAGSNISIMDDALSAGWDTQMYTLFEASEHGQVVVDGTVKPVGGGGYVTGGGPSWLAPHFGLATDNAMQMAVVTPLGEIPTLT
ncbi:LOW QUALITY PROTEIN: FAD binding domain-containing protein [Colletotrichum tofieldiae]|nr:LOW QUALITY PROTEIN: FAD binding domain-containing protein [Colletotrichum tofieldiae]